MLEMAALALMLAGGAYGMSLYQKARAHARWASLFDRAASSLGGRASASTMFDAPEMRAVIGGRTIDVRVKDTNHRGRGVIIAESKTGSGSEGLRLYLGWDVWALPQALDHVPEIPFPHAFGLSGKLTVKANDAAAAHRFAENAVPTMIDVRSRAGARALEILCRGGTLQLAVHAMEEKPAAIESVVRANAVLAMAAERCLLDTARTDANATMPPASPPGMTATKAPEPKAHITVICTLCGQTNQRGERWVSCSRCASPYHQRCWLQATGCIAERCQETGSTPLDTGDQVQT
jgi:hypothetical protein